MKYLILAILGFILIGCETTNKPIEVEVSVNPFENITIDPPPSPTPMELDNITWYVLTQETIDTYFQSSEVVLYGLTPEDYEKLTFNLAEIKRYILSQKGNNEYYERVLNRIEEMIKDNKKREKTKNND